MSAPTDVQSLIVQGGAGDRTLRIQDQLLVGRDPHSGLPFDHPEVSRRHARIFFDGAWQVEDLGSTNGTWVDGRRVMRAVVSGPCQVRFGHTGAAPTVSIRFGETEPNAWTTTSRRQAGEVGSATQTWVIGRDPRCDIVLADLLVSRRHTRISTVGGNRLVVEDLGSANGTYIDGAAVTRGEMQPGQFLGVGSWTLGWDGQVLTRVDNRSDVALSVRGVDFRLATGKALLNGVDLDLAAGSLTAVVGPSGAGKSSLFSVLTGARRATTGAVTYQGLDVPSHLSVLRHHIGVVPQEDLIHRQLTARQALLYAAELRFPADVTAAERRVRVDETIAQLGLTDHAATIVDRLSGGQRKRTSVAMELLTQPSLLFLDEPTSGLDPGLDKSVMATLRDLATGDRTVVVITHSVANLAACDNVLVLAPGGRIAYFGPPDGVLGYFAMSDYADVFSALARDPEGFQRRFESFRGYGPRAAAPASVSTTLADPPQQPLFRQMSTIGRRQGRIMLADRSHALFNLLLPVVLALLALAVPGSAGFTKSPTPTTEAMQLLVIMLVGATFMGMSASVRDLVGERPIYVRERAVGLSPWAYLLAKVVVFAGLACAQSALLVSLILWRKPGPQDGLLVGAGSLELVAVVMVTAVTGALCGLALSANVTTSEQVMPLLVVSVMAQLVLCGGLIPIAGRMPLEQFSWLAPARWGYAAAASVVDLRAVSPTATDDRLWAHDLVTVSFSVVVLLLINVLLGAAALRALRRGAARVR